jgi:hypothetical protein
LQAEFVSADDPNKELAQAKLFRVTGIAVRERRELSWGVVFCKHFED